MQYIATFIVLSITGFVNASYLAYKHRRREELVCPINHDCNAVVESKWGKMFGVRNEVLGMLFYGGMLAGGLGIILAPELSKTLRFLLLIGASTGLFYSIILTLIQKFIIKDFCFYCLISAGISLLIFMNSIALFS